MMCFFLGNLAGMIQEWLIYALIHHSDHWMQVRGSMPPRQHLQVFFVISLVTSKWDDLFSPKDGEVHGLVHWVYRSY